LVSCAGSTSVVEAILWYHYRVVSTVDRATGLLVYTQGSAVLRTMDGLQVYTPTAASEDCRYATCVHVVLQFEEDVAVSCGGSIRPCLLLFLQVQSMSQTVESS
jgi:hypothetical protein